MVRLVDIAREANVTVPVVSTVLNERIGKKGTIRVSDNLRGTILEIADRLGYTPNLMARVLKGKSSGLIGVILGSGDVEVRSRQLDAFRKCCNQMGYHLLITECDSSPERILDNYRMLLQHCVDGILCHRNVFHEELRSNPKLVVFGAKPLEGMSSLYYDIGSAYREARRLFIEEKRRHTALIIGGSSGHDSIPAREHAFRAHFGENAPVFTIPSKDGAAARMCELLKNEFLPKKIDSVLVQNDLWALTFCEQARLMGVDIPRRISVIGQDNSVFTTCYEPHISTIDPNLTEFGKAALDLLVRRIAAPEAPPETMKIDTVLIARGTTLPPPEKKIPETVKNTQK